MIGAIFKFFMNMIITFIGIIFLLFFFAAVWVEEQEAKKHTDETSVIVDNE